MVKRSTDQKLRLRNLDARNERIETEAVVQNRRSDRGIETGPRECFQRKQSVQIRHQSPFLPLFLRQNRIVEILREERVSEPEVHLGSWLDSRAEITSQKVSARDHLVIFGILPNVNSTNENRNANSMMNALLCTSKTKINPAKTRKNGDKSAVAFLKDALQLGCVSQDVEPPESSSILRKSARVLAPTRRVRHANIRESKGPSLGVIQIKNPHQGSPYAPKFEDRPQKETWRQERCARGYAWRMTTCILKLKEKDKATFFSPCEVVSPSTIRNKTGGKRIRCRFRSINAHAEQERSDFSRIGNRKGL